MVDSIGREVIIHDKQNVVLCKSLLLVCLLFLIHASATSLTHITLLLACTVSSYELLEILAVLEFYLAILLNCGNVNSRH